MSPSKGNLWVGIYSTFHLGKLRITWITRLSIFSNAQFLILEIRNGYSLGTWLILGDKHWGVEMEFSFCGE